MQTPTIGTAFPADKLRIVYDALRIAKIEGRDDQQED